jgi:IMP dehydrogenase
MGVLGKFFERRNLMDFECLEFDDVLVEPVPSMVTSRGEVDISVTLSPSLKLEFPLIAAPMRGIVNANFAQKLSDLGGIAILHRFYDTPKKMYQDIKKMQGYKFGVSVGYGDKSYLGLLSYDPNIICVDVANGYNYDLLKYCEEIKNFISYEHLDTLLMAGNVATYEGVLNLRNAGVDMVRVGVGGGGLCSTRNITGVGVPQITALMNCHYIGDVILVSDGGIKNSGDFVKAIVAGADCCMAGSIFAKTYESDNKGKIFGMASRLLMDLTHKEIKSVEGIEKKVKKIMSLKQFVSEFSWGIRSAGTYLSSSSLEQIGINGTFIKSGKGSIKEL